MEMGGLGIIDFFFFFPFFLLSLFFTGYFSFARSRSYGGEEGRRSLQRRRSWGFRAFDDLINYHGICAKPLLQVRSSSQQFMVLGTNEGFKPFGNYYHKSKESQDYQDHGKAPIHEEKIPQNPTSPTIQPELITTTSPSPAHTTRTASHCFRPSYTLPRYPV